MLINPASFQKEGEMEKAITAEIQQLQIEICSPPPVRYMLCPHEITSFYLQRSAESKDYFWT